MNRLAINLAPGIGIWIAVAVSSIFIASCTSIKSYRSTLSQCEQSVRPNERTCTKNAFYTVAEGQNNAAIAIVEFDDQGYLMQPELYHKVLDQIRAMHSEAGANLILFAHGWKHNAGHEDTNLVDFERALLSLKETDRQLCKDRLCENRQTVGVFLAWRGLSATMQPFRELSFWNRKKHAHRVGQDGAAQVIADLGTINTRQYPESKPEINRYVIVGHSFGGAIVYSAVQQRLLAGLSAADSRGTVDPSVADLIILVNPAFEAARYAAIERRASRHSFPESHRPILATFTSVGDTATKTYFPIGRTLSTLFSKYDPKVENQRRADRTAIGHFQPYNTHSLTSDSPSIATLTESLCNWVSFRTGKSKSWQINGAKLYRSGRMKSPGQYANPYYVVQVEEGVIPDHNSIWQGAFRDFIYLFVAVQKQDESRCGKQ